MWELSEHPTIERVLAAAKLRADEPFPILPRLKQFTTGDKGVTLLLPWDPDYVDGASGDSAPLNYQPAWARGPSRFVLEDRTWKHISAPGSTNAG
jgi:hypothetical protein